MPNPGVFLVPLHASPVDQPPPFTLSRLVTQWSWNWGVGIAAVVMAGLYLWGVVLLHRRGDRWPLAKTLCWCVGGVGSMVVATLSALGTYDTVLFSVHMVQHMILTMITPVFLALGGPITLALRVLPPHLRGALVAVLHSRIAKVLLFPPLATGLMCAVPFALYMTSWYPYTLAHPWAHDGLHIFFLTMGCMFFWPLLGTDPMPNRMAFPLRMLMFMITMPFHSFLGVMLMGSPALIAEQWYTSFLRAWPPSPQQDQYIAGAILWGAGDFIMILFTIALFVQWLAASQREARRIDRQLDREEAAAARAERQSGNGAGEASRPGAYADGPEHPDDPEQADVATEYDDAESSSHHVTEITHEH